MHGAPRVKLNPISEEYKKKSLMPNWDAKPELFKTLSVEQNNIKYYLLLKLISTASFQATLSLSPLCLLVPTTVKSFVFAWMIELLTRIY